MPRGVSSPEVCIDKYIKKSRKSSKYETYEQYRTVLTKITADLRQHNFDPSPYKIDEKAVRCLLDVVWKDLETSTRKWNTHILSRYLKFYNNFVVRDMDIRWPQDMRPNVDWLTEDEQYKLLNTTMTPLEEIVIHLELNLGLRVAEVCNLKLSYINYRTRQVDVLGKGHGEGKWRSVPFSDNTEKVLERWLSERSNIVKRVREYNPGWEDPGNLLIWCHYKNKPSASEYSERGHSLDRGVIHAVRDRAGLEFTNHTLRRTFGRTSYHAGVAIETLSQILGHDDIATTLKYLGINMDDMRTAMHLHSSYQNNIRNGIFRKGGVQSG